MNNQPGKKLGKDFPAFGIQKSPIYGKNLEAASGFEPENIGFAGRCLTTWLCRPKKMERETRFELATSTLARLHSTTELFPLKK